MKAGDLMEGRRAGVFGLAARWQDLAAQLAPLELHRRVLVRELYRSTLWALLAVCCVSGAAIWLLSLQGIAVPFVIALGFMFWQLVGAVMSRPLAALAKDAGNRVQFAVAEQAGLRAEPRAQTFPLGRFVRLGLLDPLPGEPGFGVSGRLAGHAIEACWAASRRGPRLLVRLPGAAAASGSAAIVLQAARGPFRRLHAAWDAVRHPGRPFDQRPFALTYWMLKPSRGHLDHLLPPPLRTGMLRLARRLGRPPAIAVQAGDLLLALPPGHPRGVVDAFAAFDRMEVLAGALDLLDLLHDIATLLAAPSATGGTGQ